MVDLTNSRSHARATAFHDQSSGITPDYGMAATRVNVLSHVLTLIRLRGELVYSARLQAPWGITFPKGAAHLYFVEEGELWVYAPGCEPLHVRQSEVVLLPHGTGHLICDKPGFAASADRRFDREAFRP